MFALAWLLLYMGLRFCYYVTAKARCDKMVLRVPARSFVKSYVAYSSVLEALGYEVEEAKVLEHVAGAPTTRARLGRLLAAYRSGMLDGELVGKRICKRLEGLLGDLVAQIEPEARRLAGAQKPRRSRAKRPPLDALVAGLSEVRRDLLADIVALGEQREMVKPRKMRVEEFQELLRDFACDQTLARQKLIAHLRGELHKRGIDMSCEAIEERFRSNPAVRTMPCCVRQIIKGLSDEFRTGLVPIHQLVGEMDAGEWLRSAQRKLMFRSQSAMHKAIAEATGLSYDCVHKALSGKRKAKRIRLGVKRGIERWIRNAERGQDIPVNDAYRGVPVLQMRAMIPTLRELFRTKEAAYRFISGRTGVRAGSIRRYFQNDGQLKFAPLSVYRVAKQLVDGEIKVPRPEPPPPAKRKRIGAAERVARKAEKALGKWRRDRGNGELERSFKDLRRELIMRLKGRRARSLAAV